LLRCEVVALVVALVAVSAFALVCAGACADSRMRIRERAKAPGTAGPSAPRSSRFPRHMGGRKASFKDFSRFFSRRSIVWRRNPIVASFWQAKTTTAGIAFDTGGGSFYFFLQE